MNDKAIFLRDRLKRIIGEDAIEYAEVVASLDVDSEIADITELLQSLTCNSKSEEVNRLVNDYQQRFSKRGNGKLNNNAHEFVPKVQQASTVRQVASNSSSQSIGNTQQRSNIESSLPSKASNSKVSSSGGYESTSQKQSSALQRNENTISKDSHTNSATTKNSKTNDTTTILTSNDGKGGKIKIDQTKPKQMTATTPTASTNSGINNGTVTNTNEMDNSTSNKRDSSNAKNKKSKLPASSPGTRKHCGCLGTIHGFVSSCASCGRIVCDMEGLGPCFFCGSEVFPPLTSADIVAQGLDESTVRAYKQKDLLLQYDKENAKRTHVHDAQSDYYETTKWLSEEERVELERRDKERRSRRLPSNRPLKIYFDVDKRETVVDRTNDRSKSGTNEKEVQEPEVENEDYYDEMLSCSYQPGKR